MSARLPIDRLLLACAFAMSAAGCAWTQPPIERQSVLPPYEISEASASSAKLLLTEDGLWSYVRRAQAGTDAEADGEPDQRAERGQLAIFVDEDEQTVLYPHLYVVLDVHAWGLTLQRLDDAPVASAQRRGRLVYLDDGDDLGAWGLCAGPDGQMADDACLEQADGWRLFGQRRPGRLIVPPRPTWGMAPPVAMDGVVHADRAVVDEAALVDGWIAVPVRADRARPLQARASVDPGCAELDLAASLQPLEVIEHSDSAASEHPVDIEAAAIEAGVDVFVRCNQKDFEVAVPSVFRPLLRVGTTSAVGVPYVATKPLRLAAPQPGGRAELALMGAALATGSIWTADFYLDRALRLVTSPTDLSKLALDTMQVPAAAGRPEAALRAGLRAVKGAWRPDNNPEFVLGRAWAYAALGDRARHAEDADRLAELVDELDHERLRQSMTWSRLRSGLERLDRRGVNGAVAYYERHELSLWLQAADVLVDWIEAPGEPHSANGSLVDAFYAPAEAACADPQRCQFDVYGRNALLILSEAPQRGVEALADELSHTARVAWRPGFVMAFDALALAAIDAIAVQAALLPKLASSMRAYAFSELVSTTAAAMRTGGICLRPSVSASFIDSLDQGGAAAGAVRASRWLLADALPAGCESAQAFADSLASGMGEHRALAAHAAPLLDAVASQTSDDARLEVLERFADVTAEYEKGPACRRWNLALAVSHLRAASLDEAEAHLGEAINCGAHADDDYRHTQALLLAYLRFERTTVIADGAGGRVRGDLDSLLRRRPTDEASSDCFGLLGLDYPLERHVHPEVAALAVAMPRQPAAELELETSSKSAAHGRASLQVARRLLTEGRPRQAGLALQEARRSFERIDHRVGLRRVAFLDEVVFGGQLHTFVDAEAEHTPEAPLPGLERAEQLSAADWARLLRRGRASGVLEALDEPPGGPTAASRGAALAAAVILDRKEHTSHLLRYLQGDASFDLLCSQSRK